MHNNLSYFEKNKYPPKNIYKKLFIFFRIKSKNYSTKNTFNIKYVIFMY